MKHLNTHGIPAKSYKTGVVPKMTYFQLVAHTNARSHFPEDLATSHPGPRTSKRVKKILEFAAELDDVTCLLEIVRKVRTAVLVRGKLHGAVRTRSGWSLMSLGGVERQLSVDASSCSCEDNRFRHRKCKHMEAMQCSSLLS